jgi:hypothetical protein
VELPELWRFVDILSLASRPHDDKPPLLKTTKAVDS